MLTKKLLKLNKKEQLNTNNILRNAFTSTSCTGFLRNSSGSEAVKRVATALIALIISVRGG